MEETGKPKLGGVAPSLMSRGSCGCGGWAGQDPAPFGAVGGRLPGGLKAVGSSGAPGCPFLGLPLLVPSPSVPSFQGNHLHGNLEPPGSASELLSRPQDLGKWLGRALVARGYRVWW